MDDHTSRQQIDELAELYLTSIIDGQGGDPPEQADNPLEGPEPIKLAPKLGNNAPKPEAVEEHDDRHPMLRLTEAETENDEVNIDSPPSTATAVADAPEPTATDTDNPTPQADEPAPRAVLEAVLMGNLPGMSGPWLTQYAQLLAQSDGPVAILHVGEQAIDMELVEPRAEAEPAPAQGMSPVRIPPMRGDKTGLVGLLDAMVRSDTTPVGTVLVRMDSDMDAQTRSRLAAIDDWTLLCGSDESSVAGAVQQIRSLVNADPRLADRNVGFMMMGSDEQAAQQAAANTAAQLEHDLANRVEYMGHLKRMQPVQVREIGSFPDPIGVCPSSSAGSTPSKPPSSRQPRSPPWRQPRQRHPCPRPARRPARRPKPYRHQAPPRQPPRAPSPAGSSAQRRRHPGSARRCDPGPKSNPAAIATPSPAPTPRAPRQAAAAPGPAIAAEPMRQAPAPRVLSPDPELDLVALLGQGNAALDNAITLDARIPDQPDIQLAVDAQGIVHILARHTDSTPIPLDERQATMTLIEAGRWVRANLELIALTQREASFLDHDPVLHLLTDRPDMATKLVGKLAGQVRLHLLQQVQVGASPAGSARRWGD